MRFSRHVVLPAMLLLAGWQVACSTAMAQSQVVPAVELIQAEPLKPAAVALRKSGPVARHRVAPVPVPVASLYQQALASLRNGRVSEAHAQLREQLQHEPQHLEARRLLISLLLEARQSAEAGQLLEEGLALAPANPDMAMALARLRAGQGAIQPALQVLEAGAEYAGQNAGYVAFMAVLEQQNGQHARAVQHLQQALDWQPGHGEWWLALGHSQQALKDREAARVSFETALASSRLSPAQQKLARQSLRQLQQNPMEK